ncbi:DNA helicase II [Thioalkalicoccus limnaeus]|uniref:DNA 3'-5' helicase n=1 Tax=Thioalkalicoccus limnaeus TaxID=120681 RepID=A0ABV4BDF0_9GAMM
MDISEIIDPLNPAQREAVTAESGNRLVLAGAGSGKTRVLVHRVAWLIRVEQAPPWAILAVTFTNKAAREMKARIEEILATPIGGMWVGTFHGLANRFLRAHWQEAGLPHSFQILDADDQYRLIRRTLKALELDEARWPPRRAMGFVNQCKDEGLRPRHLDDEGDPYRKRMIAIYREYQSACERGGLVDFGELLLRAHEVLREQAAVRHQYQERFAHILVDEFQDTNAIQYAWLRLLSGDHDNLFLVGDDDQSIYGWRGARVENIQSFQKDYANTTVVRLEQNYRSTGNILTVANALIAHNPSRLGKRLWTNDGAGEPVRQFAAFNELDEARFVIERIRQHIQVDGYRRDECAILYRTTAQSRLFEEVLIQAEIPYRVYGGLRFFERAEIRDALAYLRLVANPDDDAAFERAVNTPPRGLGPRTLDLLRDQARAAGTSLWRAARDQLEREALAPRAAKALRAFVALIEQQRARSDRPLAALAADLLVATDLPGFYLKGKDDRGQDRVENLEQLVDTVARFEAETSEDEGDAGDRLASFLAHAALEAGEAQADPDADGVQLMTLHSAKGLEFPIVFLVGLEERLFPHSLSLDDPRRLEEERRLCYVGMTRAMHQLYLTHAEKRHLHGKETYPQPSRFLREMPTEPVESVRGSRAQSRPTPQRHGQEADDGLRLGQRVCHPTFGEGVVLDCEGRGASARVQVNFADAGTKWLVLAYAKLAPAAQ